VCVRVLCSTNLGLCVVLAHVLYVWEVCVRVCYDLACCASTRVMCVGGVCARVRAWWGGNLAPKHARL